MHLPLRAIASTSVVALLATGCGLLGRPAVATQEEVVAALTSLAEGGFRSRVTADIVLDEQELRNALSSNPKALDAFRKEMDESDATADDMLSELKKAQELVEPHALLLEVGADQSMRYAVESSGTVWADLRLASNASTLMAEGGSLTDGFSFTVQAQADIPFGAELAEATPPDNDELLTGIEPFLADAPGGQAALDFVTAFLDGGLVEISGEIGPELFENMLGEDMGKSLADSFPSDLTELGFDPRQLLNDAIVFDGFRVESGLTVVDVSLNVREGARSFAEAASAFAENDPTGSMSDMSDMPTEADLAKLPEQLTNVARLYLDGAGTLTQVRIDVLDIATQLLEHDDPDDEDVAAAAELASALENSGAFIVVDISGIGSTPTVLGEAQAVLDVEQIGALVGAVIFQAFSGFDAGGGLDLTGDLDDFTDLGDDGDLDLGDFEYPHPDLRPGDITVGDCFTSDALYSFGSDTGPLTVACAQPHGYEAFFSFDLTQPAYDLFTIQDEMNTTCTAEFEPFVGIDYYESELFVDGLFPSQTEWDAGDRTVVCYLSSFEDMTGSAKNAAR